MAEASVTAYLRFPGVPPAGTRLCALHEIPAAGTKGFVFGQDVQRFELFLVYREGRLGAFVNDCPHAHTPLDVIQDQFLNLEKSLLLCATHGALFRIDDGRCVYGPCKGKALTPVPVHIKDGVIFIGQGGMNG